MEWLDSLDVSYEIKEAEKIYVLELIAVTNMITEEKLPKILKTFLQDLITEWRITYGNNLNIQRRHHSLVILHQSFSQPTFIRQVCKKSSRINKYLKENVERAYGRMMEEYNKEYGYGRGNMFMDKFFLESYIEAKEEFKVDQGRNSKEDVSEKVFV